MRLFEVFKNIFEETPNQIKKYYGDEILTLWNQKHPDKNVETPEPVVELMANACPVGKTNSYIYWVYMMWKGGHIDIALPSDRVRTRRMLDTFDKLKQGKKTKHADIRQYSYGDFVNEVVGVYRQKRMEKYKKLKKKREIDKIFKNNEVEVLIDDPEVQMLQPLTFEASALLGRGEDTDGKWCVSINKTHFYNSAGPFYIINLKPGNELFGVRRKFGVRLSSNDFQDEGNQRLSDEDIAELVEYYPTIREVLQDEANERGFMPLIDITYMKKNPVKAAEILARKSSVDIYGNDIEYDFLYVSEMDSEYKYTFLNTCCMHIGEEETVSIGLRIGVSIIDLVNVGLYGRIDDELLTYINGVSTLDGDEVMVIFDYVESLDKLHYFADWVHPDDVRDMFNICDLCEITSEEQLIRMLTLSEGIAQKFLDGVDSGRIELYDDDDILKFVKVAMVTSVPNLKKGIDLLRDDYRFEDHVIEILQSVKRKAIHIGGTEMLVNLGVDFSSADVKASIKQDPANVFILCRIHPELATTINQMVMQGKYNAVTIKRLLDNGITFPQKVAEKFLAIVEKSKDVFSKNEKQEYVDVLKKMASQYDIFNEAKNAS